MLFGNTDIVITLRKFFGKLNHAGAFAHCRCYADQLVTLLCHIAQPVAEHLRVGWLAGGLGDDTVDRVKLAHAVIQNAVVFGMVVTLALACHHMQELRTFEMSDIV